MKTSPLVLLLALGAATQVARAELQITEFSASSDGSFLDEDGDDSDWIELQNTGAGPISTLGFTLSDNATNLTKWALPDLTLAGGEFLIVFASGKDRAGPAAELHANFSLGEGDDFLGLTRPDGVTLASQFPIPKQFYGISQGAGGYYATPTPGTPNGVVDFTGFVRDTKFSVDRGLFDTPFAVEITTGTEGASIYFTTDASIPSATNGTLYSAPVPVDTTTVLRAIATKAGSISSNIDTQTYIFTADVINQAAAPPGFPATWGIDNSTNNGSTGLPRPADYEMDPEVVAQFGEAAVIDALEHHPTISLVLDPDDLWNESSDSAVGGIYPNPYGGTGNQFLPGWGTPADWERPGSVEFIGFGRVAGEQADCGVRIAGNFARHPNRYKHHLRVTFRRKYGQSKLVAPIFSRTDVDTFDDLILRGGNSESWTFPGATGNGPGTRANVQYLRDQYYKDSQVAMGHLSANQEYFHLYLNGLYWGFYTLIERVDAHFFSQHLGGDEADYDVMKQGNDLSDGSRAAWEEMFTISRSGLASQASYDAIQEFLDLDNLIDYILFNYHSGTVDWGNNWRAGRRREPGAGYMFLNWDGERALGDRGGNSTFTYDATGRNTSYHATELHHDLRANPEYRLRFADHVQRFMFNGGTLSPESNIARYNGRADEIRPSLIAESARWGDRQRPDNPYTIENEWKDELEWLTGTFFPQRHDVVLDQLRADDLFPDTAAPTFNQHGGQVAVGFPLLITNEGGDVYFTTDGSDPRLTGGNPNPDAIMTTGGIDRTDVVTAGSVWRYDDSGTDLGTAWRSTAYDDVSWPTGTAPLGYGTIDNTTRATTVNLARNITVYFRQSFTVTDVDLITAAECEIHADGGAVVYLNGTEVVRDNIAPGEIEYSTTSIDDGNEGVFDHYPIPLDSLVGGSNTIAVEVHNGTQFSSDMVLDLRLTISKPGAAALTITSPATVRARSFDNGEWSPITEATFTTGIPASAENLVISEINYNPPGPEEAGEFIELLNISANPISLAGVRFVTGIDYEFPPTDQLAPGAHIILTPADYGGQLDNGGETLTLLASDDSPIRSFRYNDKAPWPESPDGDGPTLVLANPPANPDHSLPESWLPSHSAGGSPGTTGTQTPPDGVDLIEFFLGADPIEIEFADGDRLIRVPRILNHAGGDLFVETSSDLQVWHRDQVRFEGLGEQLGLTGIMVWSLPPDSTDRFARVCIELTSAPE